MFEWEEYFEPHILRRGSTYERDGAVQSVRKQGEYIEAIVEGSEYYRVRIKYDGHTLSDAYCSCPYAAGGNYCKHMAAVLYAVDDNTTSLDDADEEISLQEEDSMLPVQQLIAAADRNLLEKTLLELAFMDDKVESRIRAMLGGAEGKADIAADKSEVDNIFAVYSGYGDFIDYHSAFGFADDLVTYLTNAANKLLEKGRYYEAFELSMYAYVKLGNCDIDDDGEITMISNCCYEIWQKAVRNCSTQEKSKIKSWFLEHADDGTVIDYMEDMLQDFLKYELADEEDLREEIRQLDHLIEESKGNTSCKSVYTSFYGYNIEAIDLRIILMKRLGADEKEIDDFRKQYICFRSVRKYFIQKARTEGDTEEEIRLLKESKALDTDSVYLVNTYSERLIEIYHTQKEYSLEKAERREAFISYQLSTIDDFRRYREMCTGEEWGKERVILINSRKDPEKRCELLAEEKMLPELFKEISFQGEKLHLFNRYGYLLMESYSEPILQEYFKYVSSAAEYARNRSSYDELIRYLKRMQQYPGGSEMVRDLCKEWIAKYPTRKVMIQELRKMI